MVIGNKFYKWYPKIRQEDIGKDTSNMFIDTCNIANPYCGLMGAGKSAHTIAIQYAYSFELLGVINALMPIRRRNSEISLEMAYGEIKAL